MAGETSGDCLGLGLMQALRARLPQAVFYGIGGPRMQSEGLKTWFDMEELAVMGITAVLARLPRLLSIRNSLVKLAEQLKPDVFIGIDAPDFNLGLARRIHALGIPVVHYVSPSIWAWRSGRIKTIKQSVDLMLTLFPFEERLYQTHDVPVKCVGHPLADRIPEVVQTAVARQALKIAADQPTLAVLPGSRGGEIKYIFPVMLESMRQLQQQKPGLQFIIPAANEKLQAQINQMLSEYALPVTVIKGRSDEVMTAADVVLLTSGTATLEALLLKKPMVVAYRWSALTHALIAPWVKSPYVALPNILAGERLVPEWVQGECRADRLTQSVLEMFKPEKREGLIRAFTQIHESLKRGANLQAAEGVVALLEKRFCV